MYVVYINTTRRVIVYRLLVTEWLRMEYSIDLPYGYTMIYAGNPAVRARNNHGLEQDNTTVKSR